MTAQVFHEEFGSGVPVLALHGWTPDHRMMSGCLEPVFAERPGYRRLYPDLPGMGKSPGGSARGSDDLLAAVSSFADEHLGAEPFLLVGESYGGYLARALVRERPGQVRGMALICPIGTEPEHARRTLPPHTVLRSDPALIASMDAAEAADFTEIAVVRSPEILARYRAEVAPGLALADETTLARVRENYTLSVPPESGPAYERPVLVLTGRQDSITGYEDQYALLGHYPRASFAVLDRAGHNLQLEQPALFGALLAEWLDRVAESG
ncbi:alpha/beta fold hydrolase [Amycolatopsis sp. CA-230715]|uniref:alpha/beta fold hydrolase n=1 Tax=Amycolatopsis sp. CA-230715 TaxID=2745196 RepID=UPI001C00B559|nr:alpha/beta hydrolase [Amycolatopsis sp. CA-230715]QWF76699.1 2-succinyl-6-hydroxy-2,4-cyclohexadiene-1-carboxylate synthase [Amycolatopsis sp. CA-230715]